MVDVGGLEKLQILSSALEVSRVAAYNNSTVSAPDIYEFTRSLLSHSSVG